MWIKNNMIFSDKFFKKVFFINFWWKKCGGAYVKEKDKIWIPVALIVMKDMSEKTLEGEVVYKLKELYYAKQQRKRKTPNESRNAGVIKSTRNRSIYYY